MKKGWHARRLAEICVVDWGNTSLTKSAYVENGRYLAVSAAGCDGRIGHKEHAKHTPVLSAIGAQCGKMFFPNEDFTAIKNTITLTPRPDIADAKFLFYLLTFVELPKRGAGQPFISKGDIQIFEVPIPPLPEQKRIVEMLDKAFEGLAIAKANAEANLQNARELFANWVGAVFGANAAIKTSSGFLTKKLGDICAIQSGAGFPMKFQGQKSGTYPFFKVSDMNLEGNETELTVANNYITEKVRKELAARIFPVDSIVFPKVGGAIATNKKRVIAVPSCVDNNVMGLLPDERSILPEFLHEWLRGFDIYEFSNKANPPSITQTTVSEWPISVPPIDEQVRLVASLKLLREQVDAASTNYARQTRELSQLTQSLLQKAFAGELT